jgi:hypothetical protein
MGTDECGIPYRLTWIGSWTNRSGQAGFDTPSPTDSFRAGLTGRQIEVETLSGQRGLTLASMVESCAA